MTALLAGLDVGTTSSKAVLFTDEGEVISEGRAPTEWTVTQAGVELSPDALAAAARAALAQAMAGAPGRQVSSIGVASMGEAGVLLDGTGRPLGPVIAWHDKRDTAELASLGSAISAQDFATTTGLPLGQQWSLTKHKWLQANVPETRTAVRRLNVAEWVVRSLGGEEVAERSLASRTGWLRLEDSTWWSDALEWSGADAALMPPLVDAGTAAGSVSASTGLSQATGATLTVAGHDHQTAAIGVGAINPGDQLDSCGTAEALVRCVAPGITPSLIAELTAAGITVGWHAFRGTWCLLGATTGGLNLQRVLSLLGVERADLPALDQRALTSDGGGVRVSSGAEGLSLSGVGDGVQPADVWRAALDSGARDIAGLHEAMTAASGAHSNLVVTGGWARCQAFLEIKKHHFGELTIPDVHEAGARGAALLGGLAAGTFASPAEFPPLKASNC